MSNLIKKGDLEKSFTHTELERFLKANYTSQYNVIANKVEVLDIITKEFREVDENDFAHEAAKKQEAFGLAPVSKDKLFTVLSSEAVSKKVNPIEEWMKTSSRPAEGTDPIKSLCDFIILEDNSQKERFVRCLKKWFIGAVKTLLASYVHRQCIVFTGKQGIGKTSFFNALLPEKMAERYTKNIKFFNPQSKDSLQVLTTYWLGFIDEIDDFMSNVTNRSNYKELMSCVRISERLPYAKTETTRKRICSFLGSCNEATFLNDNTGTQRFSVFEIKGFLNKKEGFIGSLGIEYFMQNHNHEFWAWAYDECMKGTDPEYSKEEEVENEDKNEMYKYNSSEYEILCEFMSPSTQEDGGMFYTTTQACMELNNRQKDVLITTDKLGKALIRGGFKKTAKKVAGKTARGYYIKIVA